ncbi:MAG TPA: 1-(5-phosphoribosyl)-5-amino-4-imidazole-carboxylate carboxylase, partial [Candidatus Omnitrophica bacterium]|nr:1-(5-phosphoribosyl)-5-amino-4-imidazole-carboxylate carboxylase [Candidatus Omnitrophota bacterium]
MKKGFIDLGFAKLDIEREKRKGIPEIIYAPQKTILQLKKIIQEFKKHTDLIFISKLSFNYYQKLKKSFSKLRYFKIPQLGFLGKERRERRGFVCVISAGSSDIKIAEEA